MSMLIVECNREKRVQADNVENVENVRSRSLKSTRAGVGAAGIGVHPYPSDLSDVVGVV